MKIYSFNYSVSVMLKVGNDVLVDLFIWNSLGSAKR